MKRVIVADTGPLIALAKLELLPLLSAFFYKLYIPEQVLLEATRQCERGDAKAIGLFVKKHGKPLKDVDNDWVQSFRLHLDEGEIQAIYHARELSCGVLTDERRGRRVASQLGIATVGVLGVLIQAKKQGMIDNVQSPMQELVQLEYRLSKPLMAEALRLAGED